MSHARTTVGGPDGCGHRDVQRVTREVDTDQWRFGVNLDDRIVLSGSEEQRETASHLVPSLERDTGLRTDGGPEGAAIGHQRHQAVEVFGAPRGGEPLEQGGALRDPGLAVGHDRIALRGAVAHATTVPAADAPPRRSRPRSASRCARRAGRPTGSGGDGGPYRGGEWLAGGEARSKHAIEGVARTGGVEDGDGANGRDPFDRAVGVSDEGAIAAERDDDG